MTSYERDGFVVLRQTVSRTMLADVNNDIARLFRIQAMYLNVENYPPSPWTYRSRFKSDAVAVLKADVTRYINTARMTQELPSVARILAHDKLVTQAKGFGLDFPVTSTKPSVHIMDEDLVVPGGYHRSPPHQDWRSIQGSLDNVVMWIPTTPVRGTGLEVVRGSHTAGLLPTVEHAMTLAVEHAGPWEAIDCDPGDVVVFSSFLVHRTSEKSDGLVRIALSTRFNNAAEPTFVERGFPTNYRYSYATALDAPTARIAAPPSDSADGGSTLPSPRP